MAAENLRVVQEYGPEHAGELVGWANVRRNPAGDGLDFILADIAYARVGEQGARYTLYEYQPGEYGYTDGCITGFDKGVQLSIAALDAPAQRIEVNPRQTPRFDRRSTPYSAYPKRRFADSLDYSKPEDETGEWSLGAPAILQSIRRQLRDNDGAYLYPVAYYTLAGIADSEDLLADPNMAVVTDIELHLAENRLMELMNLVAANRRIMADIDEIGASKLHTLTDKFVQSRQSAANVEKELGELQSVSAMRGRLYLPSGVVRSWPYMDAIEKDEDRAFGRELEFLKMGKRAPVTHQLEAETKELQVRSTNAKELYDLLCELTRKELELAAE